MLIKGLQKACEMVTRFSFYPRSRAELHVRSLTFVHSGDFCHSYYSTGGCTIAVASLDHALILMLAQRFNAGTSMMRKSG